MGSDSSSVEASSVRPYTNNLYMPVTSTRFDDERRETVTPSNRCSVRQTSRILKMGFAGIWSDIIPSSLPPIPRTGNFSAYDAENHIVYIGYGIANNDELLSDVWSLNTLTLQWSNVKLSGTLFSPRSGSRALFHDGKIIIFGGYSEPDYYSDLHFIDVSTGIVSPIETTGDLPQPRTSPILALYNNKFYVWGGYNGQWPSSLSVLDLNSLIWTEYPTEISGRTNIPFIQIDNIVYSYGGSRSGGLLLLDLDNNNVRVEKTRGAEPPYSVMGSGMVQIEKFLIFFGGRASSNWTLMYACDITKKWWFVFHVLPDGETVTYSDGTVSDTGIFMLPRIHDFGVIYEEQKRKIIAFLGAPERNPSPLFVVSVAPALSVIHLRDDMSDVLYATQ